MSVKHRGAIFNELRPDRGMAIHARACELARDGPRHQAYLAAALDKCPTQFFTSTPVPLFR